MSETEKEWLNRMESLIPGWNGQYKDYHVIVEEQRALLASLPPLDRFAMAALSTKLRAPALWDCARFIADKDKQRQLSHGKPMTDDHLKQEAAKWAKAQPKP